MKKKKILALVLAASMAGGMLAGCGATSSGDETAKGDKSSGKVYYLNFKPEQADQWVEIAKEYTDLKRDLAALEKQTQEIEENRESIRVELETSDKREAKLEERINQNQEKLDEKKKQGFI